MKGLRAANRYAKSFLKLGIDQGKVEELYADMKLVANTIHDSRDLAVMLHSPIVKSDNKITVLKKIFESKISKPSMEFISLITRKRRETLLEEIANEVVKQYKDYKGIMTAEVIAAVSMSEDMKKKILAMISEKAGSQVELIEKTDPSLIGGFIIKFGDRQYDASVAHRLKELRKVFSDNPFIREM
ncbi:MAG: ATP synthase F1 subunit delta [Flavobacteriales bacterium]|nr:ATP synthase F1 subunit delta [Flavobacteriales bacterium]